MDEDLFPAVLRGDETATRFRPHGTFFTEVDDDGRYDREVVLLQSSLPRRPKALDLFRRTLVETIDQPE